MMTTTRLYAPTRALPAIAAALALSSTSALAQEAQPTTTAPATTVQPAPDTTAPATDTTTTAPATDTSTATTTTRRSVKRTVRTSAAKPAPVVTRTVTRTVTKRAAVPAAAATPKPAAPAAAPPAAQPAAAPVLRLNAKPAPAKTPPSQPIDNDTLEIAGGGLLALLALGGTAAALIGRRRQRREKELADAQAMAYEPFETAAAPEHAPAVHHAEPATAASAFAWGKQAHADEPARADERTADGDDRRPGESWVERAYRGPSANNPSVSLRTRLKRAAFFDKREREAAAGTSAPVDASAGLPDAMVEEQERETA